MNDQSALNIQEDKVFCPCMVERGYPEKLCICEIPKTRGQYVSSDIRRACYVDGRCIVFQVLSAEASEEANAYHRKHL